MKRERYVVSQTTGETTENSTGEGEIPCISEFEDQLRKPKKKVIKNFGEKKESSNDNNIKEIDLAGKEISGIYGQYGVNLIHNGNIKIKKGKLKIINKYKENKTEYEIVIENGTLDTGTGDNIEIDYFLDSIESIKFNILFKNYKNRDFTLNSFSIDLGDNIFSLNDGKTLYKKKKEDIKGETGITGKISSLISGILLKKK